MPLDMNLVHPNALTFNDTVNINPGTITTLAGSGAASTVDGTGAAASFKDMGGAVVVGNYSYVATIGAIRKINLSTGVVTTLAGHSTLTGCVQDSNPTNVRFGEYLGSIDTDGTFLYVADPGCGVRKVSLATGATTLLYSGGNDQLTMAPNGYVYLVNSSQVRRLDTTTGATSLVVNLGANESGLSIVADATYLWVTEAFSPGYGCRNQLLRITISDGSMAYYIGSPGACSSLVGTSHVISAGNYLYVSTPGDTGIERITKSDGTVVKVAGTSGAGNVDATGTDAWFSKITGLASDGTALWVNDSGNHTFRKAVAGSSLPFNQSSLNSANVNIYPGTVSTLAGDGSNGTLDGTGTGAHFSDMGGSVVVGNFAYVATTGSIRKVDLATGAVSTFAGHATATGCVDSTSPGAARFGTSLGSIDSDGTYLYVSDGGCGIRRVSLTTGATSTVTTLRSGPVAVGPDGFLYMADGNLTDGSPAVLKLDPVSGTFVSVYPFPMYKQGKSIASDAGAIWVGTSVTPSYPCSTEILKIEVPSGATTVFAPNGCVKLIGSSQLASAGRYLYASNWEDTGVMRISKSTGATTLIAGGPTGMAEGDRNHARFAKVAGLASDGKDLWVADSGNHRFRRLRFKPLMAQELGPQSSPDTNAPRAVAGDPVDTKSGNFTWSTTDVAVPGKGVPFTYTRYYNSQGAGAFDRLRLGAGWTDTFSAQLEFQNENNGIYAMMPEGQMLRFTPSTGTAYTSDPGVKDTLVKYTSPVITYVLTRPDQSTYTFDLAGALTKITDPAGQTLLLDYSGGKLTSVTDTTSRVFNFHYDPASGFLDELQLPGGRTVGYTVSGGRLTAVRDLNGNSWTYTWSDGLLAGIYEPSGSSPIVYNSYDPYTGRVYQQTDWHGGVSTYDYLSPSLTYVSDGRSTEPGPHTWIYAYSGDVLNYVEDPNGNRTTYSFDSSLNTQTVTDPRSNVWTYGYDGSFNVTSITPPSPGSAVSFTWDNKHRMTSAIDGRGNKTRWLYSGANLECMVLPTLAAATTVSTCAQATSTYRQHTIDYTYLSGTSLPTAVTDQKGHTTQYGYDGSGNLTSVTSSMGATSGSKITYGYDSQGRKTSMVSAQGNALSCSGSGCDPYRWVYAYDNADHVTSVADPLGNTTTYHFDAAGNLDWRKDARLKTTAFAYLPGGHIRQVTPPIGGSSVYTYDGAGNLKTVTDQLSHVTTYDYFGNNQVKSVTDPLSRVWSWVYDVPNGRATQTLPSGQKIEQNVDALSRLTSVKYYASSGSLDPNTPQVSYAYDANGNRTQLSSSTQTTSYGYDPMNRMCWAFVGSSSAACGSAPASSTSYTYDDAGNLTKRQYPDGTKTFYQYDNDDRLCYAQVTTSAPTAACTSAPAGATAWTFDAANAKVLKTLPTANGYVATYTYDKAGRLSNLTNIRSGTTLSKFNATLDAVGNPTLIAMSGEKASFQYDDANRVTQACYYSGTSCSGTFSNLAYSYDGVGNLTSKIETGTSSSSTYYGFDAADQLCWSASSAKTGCTPSGATLYTSDANGNFLGSSISGQRSFTYDAASRLKTTLKSGVTDTMTYDGDGNRLSDANGSTTTNFIWDPNASVPLLESDSGGGTNHSFFYGGESLISTKIGSAQHYYLTDGMGTVANVVSANGTTTEGTYTYEPFGAVRVATETGITQPLRFDGQYRETWGHYNLRAREYEPASGRFFQRDPAASALSDPVVSSYVFANDSPTVLSDPSGMSAIGDTLWEAVHHPFASWSAAPAWSKVVAGASAVIAIAAGVTACALATGGICAGFTVFGLGNVAAEGTGATLACEEYCDDVAQASNLAQRVAQTIDRAKNGVRLYTKDGGVFTNDKALLPAQEFGYYTEWTVVNPNLLHRGVDRIVMGQGGDFWFTWDHYKTFVRI
jgi:RHS repeat-associated protein